MVVCVRFCHAHTSFKAIQLIGKTDIYNVLAVVFNLKSKYMGWNHRILAHEHNGEVYLQIHEVYYNENNIPDSYTERAVSIGGEDLKSITWTLNKMLECRTKPVLWAGEKFPNECKIKYTCDLCGRNTFDRPSPHRCSGGFRKRGLRWSLNYR